LLEQMFFEHGFFHAQAGNETRAHGYPSGEKQGSRAVE